MQLFRDRSIVRAALATLSGIMVSAAAAAPLTGSGAHLPIPGPNPGDPPRDPADLTNITAAGFDGTWSAPALAPWHGTFTASGPVPSSLAYPTGTTTYNFAPLAAGWLPAGTFFFVGDVDGGSTQNETFTLTAYDPAGALITTPWLDEPLGVIGVGTGPGNAIVPGDLPGWSWNAGTGEYFFDGSTITTGNPSVGAFMESNAAIGRVIVERTSQFANFSISAPIPEPTTAALLLAAAALGLRRRH